MRSAAAEIWRRLGRALNAGIECFFRWAFRWFMPLFGLMAFVMAWGRWIGWVQPPGPPTWRDSPAALIAAGLLIWGFELLRRWTESLEFPESTLQQRGEGLQSVQQMLKENVSDESSLRALLAREAWPSSEDLEVHLRRMLDWAAAHDAELWFYNSDAESWENLCGECGFALVRDGRVIDAELWILN